MNQVNDKIIQEGGDLTGTQIQITNKLIRYLYSLKNSSITYDTLFAGAEIEDSNKNQAYNMLTQLKQLPDSNKYKGLFNKKIGNIETTSGTTTERKITIGTRATNDKNIGDQVSNLVNEFVVARRLEKGVPTTVKEDKEKTTREAKEAKEAEEKAISEAKEVEEAIRLATIAADAAKKALKDAKTKEDKEKAEKEVKKAEEKLKAAKEGRHKDRDDLFNIWVEKSSGKPIVYETIKCNDSVLSDKNKCETFIKEFVDGNSKTKHEYIKKLATDIPTITDIKKVNPQIALSFLSALGVKKRKYLDDREQVKQILYKVEPYSEWLSRVTDEDKDKDKTDKRSYASAPNVKKFITELISILNNNLEYINKGFKPSLIDEKFYDKSVDVKTLTPDVPKAWKDKGLEQSYTDRWYKNFAESIRDKWAKDKEEYAKATAVSENIYGKKVDLQEDQPREGIAILFDRFFYPGQNPFRGGAKISSLLESKWSNIKEILSTKDLKLMGNVDIDDKLKEFGEINEKKDALLKIMSDYSNFVTSSKLNSPKDISLLIGGFQELLSKEEETEEYLNKKLYIINELLNHVN